MHALLLDRKLDRKNFIDPEYGKLHYCSAQKNNTKSENIRIKLNCTVVTVYSYS